MNDPHVETLRYQLALLEPAATFKNPSPVTHTTPDFTITLDAGEVTVAMQDHFAYDHEARATVEPVLRAWEESSFLEGRRIRFDFRGADVIDRDAPRGEIGASISDSIAVAVHITGSAEEHHEIASYPAPPQDFALDARRGAADAHAGIPRRSRTPHRLQLLHLLVPNEGAGQES
jgi:hypothetical protein